MVNVVGVVFIIFSLERSENGSIFIDHRGIQEKFRRSKYNIDMIKMKAIEGTMLIWPNQDLCHIDLECE
jgi:hypothetical protein